ncbi:MAG: 1-deoxy-D-xylulose-5-phosphate reductoisomerase [Oscillospiraceae bacterium]|nr:1-deoxy-D-xylulose-5-phosphate reductoisomerase [Oscillospiraceae bacterium]
MKRITILGSTGSIGVQALQVIERLGWQVVALTAHSNTALLHEQVRKFNVKHFACGNAEEIANCAAIPCDIVLNAIVGIAGLRPTVAALEAGNPVALANKESLVAGGHLVMALASAKGLPILPVDSEHSAIFQCLHVGDIVLDVPGDRGRSPLRKLILTASGGAFFGKTREELTHVTAADALCHPTWNMGAKITVDSATLFNKGLEVIEAAWLFGMHVDDIDVVVHRQSIVHSLVEYNDGAVLAQLGAPDMQLPIQYALTYPARLPMPAQRLNLAVAGTLTFEAVDHDTFPAIELCKTAWRRGGLACAALNGANEAANALFRQGKLGFLDITPMVEQAMLAIPAGDPRNLEDIFAVDNAARQSIKNYALRIMH